MRRTAIVLLLLVAAAPAAADELRWSEPALVAAVPGGTRLMLEDGREVRLAGIRLPLDPELALPAHDALRRLAAGRAVRLGLGPLEADRYGRIAAQVERADGLWLQGALLEQGFVLVQTRPGETALAARVLERERRARAAGRGLWADPASGPHAAEVAHRHIGSFQIVRGRVLRVARTDHYVYLNFGHDWRTDFTLRIRRTELDGSFESSRLNVDDLAGRRVQARGFLVEAGGPLIEVSHPEQIEILP